MNSVAINLNGKAHQTVAGTPVSSLLSVSTDDEGLPYIAALVNNDVVSLSYPLSVNSDLVPLTAANPHGWRVYRRSLSFLLAKVVRDLFPDADFSLAHSFGPGLYCSFSSADKNTDGITQEQLSEIDKRMRELVARDLPIERNKISYSDAVKELTEYGQIDTLNLLRYRNPPRVVVHWCDGFYDLAHGPLVPATGVLSVFKLIHYKLGFVLQTPSQSEPAVVPAFEDQPHLFQIFKEHKEWGRILGVNTVGRLNELVANSKVQSFIRTEEALHEKKLSGIADRIASRRKEIKLLLVAGPSCAGKTTFAKRLATHLRVNGLSPVTVSTDNYFVGAGRNPMDEDGHPDYEHVEAVDLELFNSDLLALTEGKEIRLPKFNFETKERNYRGNTLRLNEEEILIIEGIHGLNPRLTEMIPSERKYKIYISALTQLGVDANNRISTTDNRLIRRMVRDWQFRGHSAIDTLRMWAMVRRGENRWIFPFQKEADATFNSALDYELAVLKTFVEPLLMTVKPTDPEYAESRRLSEFLLSFLRITDSLVPLNSILREYIGGSSLNYS